MSSSADKDPLPKTSTQVDIRQFPLWKKLLFTAIPFLLFFGFAELTLRFFLPMKDVRVMCFHPLMQRAYCPEVKGIIKYGALLEVNKEGMIDQEYPVDRSPGTFRVAVLGDSFTAGEEVGMGKRFHELWEQRLPEQLGKPAEFLNFGVRGYGTWHQLQMFHLRAAKYKPDWVVVNFLWMNDVIDNLNRLKEAQHNPLNDDYPRETFWQTLQIKRKNFNKWLWNHSAAYQFFRTHYNKFELWFKLQFREDYQAHLDRIEELKNKETEKAKGPKHEATGTGPAARLMKNTDSPFDDLFFFDSEGWDITRKLFLKLKQEVEKAGGRLAVIHFPSEDQVENYPALPRKEFNQFLEENAIPHLDLFDRYKQLSREALLKTTLVKEHGDHHFSEFGHQLYADWTLTFITSLALPKAQDS